MEKYVVKNIPRRIYLQPLCENYFEGDEEEEEEVVNFDSLSEVTWCKEKLFSYGIEYVRKDLFDNLMNAFKKLKQKELNNERVS